MPTNNNLKNTAFICVLFAVILTFSGCSDLLTPFEGVEEYSHAPSINSLDRHSEANESTLKILLTDKPIEGNIEAVVVTISRVDVVWGDDRPHTTLLDEPRTFDLLQLRNGVTETLAMAPVPPGVVEQIRLIVSDAYVVIDGQEEPLRIASGSQTGIKLQGPIIIPPGVTRTIVVDFDAEKSIHKTGKGLLMTPSIEIVEHEVTLHGPDGQPVSDFNALSSIFVSSEGLSPATHYELRLVRHASPDEVISRAVVTTDGQGNLPISALIYNGGLDNARIICGDVTPEYYVSLEQRILEFLSYSYRIDVVHDGEVIDVVPIEPLDDGPMVFSADENGNPLDGFYQGEEDVYAVGRNFPPGSMVRVAVVRAQRSWSIGDYINDISGFNESGGVDAEVETIQLGPTDTTFIVKVWSRGMLRGGSYDIVAQVFTPGQDFIFDENTYADNSGFSGFLVQGPGIGTISCEYLITQHIDQNVTVVAQPAGASMINVTSKDAYLPDQDIWIAVDPHVRGQDIIGNNVDVYVVDDLAANDWTDGLSLIDVSGGHETIVVQRGCANVNYQLIWPAPVPTGILEGNYDVVIDVNQNGQYDIGVDIVDGIYGVGFYVAQVTIDIVDTVRKYWGTTDDFAPNAPLDSQCTGVHPSCNVSRTYVSCECPTPGLANINTRIEPEGEVVRFKLSIVRETQAGDEEIAVLADETRTALGPTNDNGFLGSCPQNDCPSNIFTDSWDGTASSFLGGLPSSVVDSLDRVNIGLDTGPSCSTNAECDPGYCSVELNNVCVYPCVTDSDCPAGLFCNTASHTCGTWHYESVKIASLRSGRFVHPGRYIIVAGIDTDSDGVLDTYDRESITVPQLVYLNFLQPEFDEDLNAFGLYELSDKVKAGIVYDMERHYLLNEPDPTRRVNVRFYTEEVDLIEPYTTVDIGDSNTIGYFGACPPGNQWNQDAGLDLLHSDGAGIYPRRYLDFNRESPSCLYPDDCDLFDNIFGPVGMRDSGADRALPWYPSPADTACKNLCCTESDPIGSPGVCGPPCVNDCAGSPCVSGLVSINGTGCAVTSSEAATFNWYPDPTRGTGFPDMAQTREDQVYNAYRSFVGFIANTTSHELGHKFGVATDDVGDDPNGVNILRTDDGAHNARFLESIFRPPPNFSSRQSEDSETNIMDGGGTKDLLQRIAAEPYGVQCFRKRDNLVFMRSHLPYKSF
jgi:hypothetical protein